MVRTLRFGNNRRASPPDHHGVQPANLTVIRQPVSGQFHCVGIMQNRRPVLVTPVRRGPDGGAGGGTRAA
jgi:hypothetical protein